MRMSKMNRFRKFTLVDLEVLALLHRFNAWTSMHLKSPASFEAQSCRPKWVATPSSGSQSSYLCLLIITGFSCLIIIFRICWHVIIFILITIVITSINKHHLPNRIEGRHLEVFCSGIWFGIIYDKIFPSYSHPNQMSFTSRLFGFEPNSKYRLHKVTKTSWRWRAVSMWAAKAVVARHVVYRSHKYIIYVCIYIVKTFQYTIRTQKHQIRSVSKKGND